MSDQHARIGFEFVIPADQLLASAREMLASPIQEYRDIAKAVLEVTDISLDLQHRLSSQIEADFAPYFDYWFGDAIEAAKRHKASSDKGVAAVAESLIAQEEAIVHSKEAFLLEAKRLNIRPNPQ